MGGIYGAAQEISICCSKSDVVRTYITLATHGSNLCSEHRVLVSRSPTSRLRHIHHREVRMALYLWFADAECRVTL